MKVFLITALCASLAYAKPQYNYPAPPSGSYGAPGGGGISTVQTGGGSSSFASAASFGAGGSGFGGGGGGFGGGTGESGFTGNLGIPGRQGAAFGGGIGGGGGGFGGGAGGGGGGTLVQKHIYVHVAPPEPEEFRPQRPIAAGQSTKHYKIIFIKAPSYQSYQQQILQAQAQNEEKTLVYVLVKRPDDVADITLPTAAPTAPSKPEVYFIRYKAKSEVSGGGGGGIGIGAAGSQLSGSGAGLGGGASLSLSSSSASNSQFNLNTGDSSSSISSGRPATSYGPPGKSGPY